MSTTATNEIPLFREEGPTWYHAAFEYHRPWAKPPPYQTPLTPADETSFETWVTTYSVPFDITAQTVDYDMRGYWVARVKGTSISFTLGEHPPDLWLTPYSTRFSASSLYAREGCPYNWHGDKLINEKDGTLIFFAGFVPALATAGDLLEKSKLDPAATTKGLMGEDLDLQRFALYVSGKLRLKAVDQIMDANITRTIEGASTVQIELNDDDREILRSGLLTQMLDFELDGLWFRLCQVAKDERDTLTLTFETREIALLRLRNEVKVVSRAQHTRAEFVLSLIRELPYKVPVVIPELHVVQAVEGTSPGETTVPGVNNEGIPTDLPPADDPTDIIFDPRRNLTVKGEKPRSDQVSNVNTILGVGVQMGARRKVLVCSMMTATQESSITNLPDGDADSAGCFQQRPSTGWGTYQQVTNVAYAASSFFRKAIAKDREEPNMGYGDLCQSVQISAYPRAYDQWKPEAENWVTAYTLSKPVEKTAPLPLVAGVFGNIAETINVQTTTGVARPVQVTAAQQGEAYFYYRGVPGAVTVSGSSGDNNDIKTWGLEDSWTCIQRLAGEVNWRAFFVGGTFWFLDDFWLFSMKPIMNITESSAGVDNISFDYDRGKKLGTVTLKVRVGRWLAQPGAVVVLQNMGPVNGKWLVNEFTRSLFDLTATVILKKPMPELLEPATSGIDGPPTQTPPQDQGTGPVFGGTPGENDGTRDAIVAVARRALAEEQKGNHYNYEQARPYPASLWGREAHETVGIDCSSFCIMVYKEANAQDPSGNGFNGSGNSDSIAVGGGGHWTSSPLPGDIVEFGSSRTSTDHVGIYVGGGQMINIGSDRGIWLGPVNYRSDLVGYRSFFPDNPPELGG